MLGEGSLSRTFHQKFLSPWSLAQRKERDGTLNVLSLTEFINISLIELGVVVTLENMMDHIRLICINEFILGNKEFYYVKKILKNNCLCFFFLNHIIQAFNSKV